MTNSHRREKIDPIWWAPVLLLVVVAISALTAMLFAGTLRSYEPLTLVSDRAGLVMEDGAKVKLRGVQVGEVTNIGAETGAAGDVSKLTLKIDPEPFKYLPSNLEAEIKSSTAFGAKYVDLIVPADGAGAERLKPGSVVRSRNVTVEVNTVFQSLQGVVQSIDPAKLNSILSAVAESPRRTRMRRRTSCRFWMPSQRPAPPSATTRRRSTHCCCRRSASRTPVSTRSAETSRTWCAP
jgi:phospholipid/cholesterol/gamma-HCH transport system substrate-binding protein